MATCPWQADRLRKDPRFKWITLVWVPFQLFFLVFAIYATTKWTLSPVQWLGMAVSIGFLNGILGRFLVCVGGGLGGEGRQ